MIGEDALGCRWGREGDARVAREPLVNAVRREDERVTPRHREPGQLERGQTPAHHAAAHEELLGGAEARPQEHAVDVADAEPGEAARREEPEAQDHAARVPQSLVTAQESGPELALLTGLEHGDGGLCRARRLRSVTQPVDHGDQHRAVPCPGHEVLIARLAPERADSDGPLDEGRRLPLHVIAPTS